MSVMHKFSDTKYVYLSNNTVVIVEEHEIGVQRNVLLTTDEARDLARVITEQLGHYDEERYKELWSEEGDIHG